jgi:hypothetical protein
VASKIGRQTLDQPSYSGVIDQRRVLSDDIETPRQIPVKHAVKRRMVEVFQRVVQRAQALAETAKQLG